MAPLRIVYSLTRVACRGACVGGEWDLTLETGAGLVGWRVTVDPEAADPSAPVILGVREHPADAAQGFERELWWARAAEVDGDPESGRSHGISPYTPVWVPLEPGNALLRELVIELSGIEPARLHVEVHARSLEPDEPTPEVDAIASTSAERPELTAGELPAQFEAQVEGVEIDDLPIVGTRLVIVGRDDAGPGVPADPRAYALAQFLTQVTSPATLTGFEARAAIYELRNQAGEGFWIGKSSSMGRRSNRQIIEAFAAAAPALGVPISSELGGFEERPSLLVELLADVYAVDLGPTADALAELIMALVVQYPERAFVEREVYVRTALIGDHSGEWTSAFVVDAMPYTGPDEVAYLVVWTDAWTE